MDQKIATTWWLAGLPGAGRTTLAQALATTFRERGEPVFVLDGDELRTRLYKDLGFDEPSRAESVRRAAAHIVQLLNGNGIHAVVAIVSHSAQAREAAYTTIGQRPLQRSAHQHPTHFLYT